MGSYPGETTQQPVNVRMLVNPLGLSFLICKVRVVIPTLHFCAEVQGPRLGPVEAGGGQRWGGCFTCVPGAHPEADCLQLPVSLWLPASSCQRVFFGHGGPPPPGSDGNS